MFIPYYIAREGGGLLFSWIILTGLLLSFMIGTYYLYYYWYSNYNNLEQVLQKNIFERIEKVPKVDKQSYEFAYQNNTNFDNKANKINKSVQIHQVYAFHSGTPNDQGKETHKRKEGKKEEGFEEINKQQTGSKDIYKEKETDSKVIDKGLIISNDDENIEEKEITKPHKINDQSKGEATSNNDTFVSQQEDNLEGGMVMPEVQQVEGLELIKTPVVIGENVIQKMEVTDLVLDMPAIKVRDINATIRDIQTDVIEDKVIIQGTIHKQIFYVGTDDIIHHQSEDIEFSTFIDVPGAEAGMDVLVEPTIEHVVAKLIADGAILHQKVVLQFFVKVLSVQQLIVEVGSGPLVKTDRVIGENAVQTMVINDVTLAVEAIKIVDITAEVRDLETEVIDDKVIIQGIVHKQLFYIGEDDVEHHQGEDIPFSEFVDIPGAEPGMNVQVHPTVEHIKQELSPDGTTVTQEIVLELFVKVTETVQINIVTGEDSLVMLPEVIGENMKQILSETTLELDQAAIKVKEINASFEDINAVVINDKVIVQGIIHKQIFYVGEDNVEYHQAENVPFSTFIDIMGARPGMDVDVVPTIAFIKPILSPTGELLTQKVIADIFVKVSENIQFNVSEVGPYGV